MVNPTTHRHYTDLKSTIINRCQISSPSKANIAAEILGTTRRILKYRMEKLDIQFQK